VSAGNETPAGIQSDTRPSGPGTVKEPDHVQSSDDTTTQNPFRVLIIEDDESLASTVRYAFQRRGHHVTVSHDGLEGVKTARGLRPDVIILDLMLPNIDGREVCRYLRGWTDAPILMLTALDREEDVIAGLELGADDYVTKPFRMNELVARVNALMRRVRSQDDQGGTLISGDLTVLVDEHRAFFGERELRLTPKEFQILTGLMRRAGKVLTRAELMREAWDEDVIVDPRNVDVHIRLIRAQLEGGPDGSWLIQTVHGVGYRFAGELGPHVQAPAVEGRTI
jgi:DNA-binding response OmpR family regulator